MNNKRNPLRAAGAAALATLSATVLLVACGGGGGGGDNPPAEDPALVPASATGSVAAWFKFTSTLPASDTAEALLMTNVGELPSSETEEPAALGQ